MPFLGKPFFRNFVNAEARFSIEIPTKLLVPMVIVSGLSVVVRIVKQGIPKTVVSSEIPLYKDWLIPFKAICFK